MNVPAIRLSGNSDIVPQPTEMYAKRQAHVLFHQRDLSYLLSLYSATFFSLPTPREVSDMSNIFSEDYLRNPFPVYEQIRAVSPLLRHPESGLWMLFDYAGVNR